MGTKLGIIATHDVWLYAEVDGKRVFEGILKAGQREVGHERGHVLVWTGNASSLSVSFNGSAEAPLGRAGEVLKKDFVAAISG